MQCMYVCLCVGVCVCVFLPPIVMFLIFVTHYSYLFNLEAPHECMIVSE